MNYTQSQQENKINPLILGIMNENNSLKLEILNYFVYLSTRFRFVFPSQGTIAAKFGVTRGWVNALLAEWKQLGVIKYRQQGFNRSCIYILNPLLEREKNRIKFKLPAAVLLLSISSLCSAVFQEELTLSNIRKYIYENSYEIVTVPSAEYGFYEERPTKEESITYLFIPTTTTTRKTCIGVVIKKEKETVMLNEASRNFIIRSQNNPNAKVALENPEIVAAVFTPLMEQVQHSLKWDERETLFLAAIPTEAVTYTYGLAKRILDGSFPITTPIDDSFNWFVGVASKKCKELGLHIDRRFYQALCQIKGIEPVVAGENPKPLRQGSKPRNPSGHSPAKEEPKMTENERIGFLTKEIAGFKEKISNPQKYFLPNVNLVEALEAGTALLAAREQELADLLNPPAKIIDK